MPIFPQYPSSTPSRVCANIVGVTDAQNAANHPEKAAEAAPKQTESATAADARGTAEVFMAQAEVVGQVTDVIGDAESSESSEDGEGYGEGEQSGKGKQSSSKKSQPTQPTPPPPIPIPPPTLMRKQIAQEIRKEIREEEKKVIAAYFGFKKVAPDHLAEILAHIRQLKDILASIVELTADALKTMYLKWVRKEAA